MARKRLIPVEEVVVRAMERFRTYGYHATSVQNLEDCTGISRGSLYNTFSSKRALFLRTLHHYIKQTGRSFQGIQAQASSPVEAILGVFEEAVCNGCFIVNTTVELAAHDEEIEEIVTEVYRETEHRFQELIELGQSGGEVAAGVDPSRPRGGCWGCMWACGRLPGLVQPGSRCCAPLCRG